MNLATSMRPRARAALALLCVSALTACGADTGSLDVQLEGLPSGAAAGITVQGPEGFDTVVDETAVLEDLEPGSYRLAFRTVLSGDDRYLPVRPAFEAVVRAGEATVHVARYTADPTEGLVVAPSSLHLGARTGAEASGHVLLRGTGYEPLTCTLSTSDAWLTVEGAGAAEVAPGELRPVALVGACEAAGLYEGTVQVSCDVGGPAAVAVRLACSDAAAPRVSEPAPRPLLLAAAAGREAAGTLTFANTGSALLTWTASGSAGWLELTDPAAGTLAPGAAAKLAVTGRCASAGTLEGSVEIASDDPADPVVTAPVALRCSGSDAPDLALAEGGPLALTAVVGETARGSLSFANAGGGVLTYVVSSAAGWLFVEDDAGTLAPGASASSAIVATCASAGARTAVVSLFTDDPDEPVVGTEVQLTCRPPPAPDIGAPEPARIDVSGPPQEAFVLSLAFANEGDAPLEYTAEKQVSWFAVSPSAGTVAPGETATLQVTVACPARADVFESELTLASNDPDEPAVAVPVRADCTTTADFSFAHAYLVQVAQNPEGSVELVAGWPALARAFVVANAPGMRGVGVRLHAWNGGTALGTVDLAPPDTLPTDVPEDAPGTSFDAVLPDSWLQPGLQVQFEIDPDGRFAETDEDNNLYPADGPWDLSVRTVPNWAVTLVPVVYRDVTGDVSTANAEAYLNQTVRFEPVVGYDVEVRAPYTYQGSLGPSDGAGWSDLLGELRSLRIAEQSNRHYIGIVDTGYTSGIAGMGFVGYPAAVVSDGPSRSGSLAHEVGHNWGRSHAPCGVQDPDGNYPHAGGSIGVWGWNREADTFLSPATYKDFMGYCDPVWASDYTFQALLRYRANRTLLPDSLPAQPVIFLRGVVTPKGVRLEPAFHFEARPMPPEPGDWRVVGLDAQGRKLFSASFHPDPVSHADEAHFGFSLPLDADAAGRIEALRVYGPEGLLRTQRLAGTPRMRPGPRLQRADGEVRLTWDGAAWAGALVRDADTGEVISLGRGPSVQLPAGGGKLEVLLSDGVRTRREVLAR